MTVDLADYQLEGLRPGTRLRTHAGRQVVVGIPIGGGNEGIVLHGECGGETVAVKVLRPDRTGTRAQRTRALVERAIPTKIDPRIAGPFDSLEYDGRVGHVSRLVPGIDVAALADNPAALNPRQRVLCVIKLGAMLVKLHAGGVAFGDLNKGAVKVLPVGNGDADVFLVDLDSAVMRGIVLPPTLGAPDTASIELRRGVQPATVEGWQASDWTAFGHVALELLLNKTAGCGIDEPDEQVKAYFGVPPFLQETPRGKQIDGAAGLPSDTLTPELRRLLRRLFDSNPAVRDGRALLKVLVAEVVNNHQICCSACSAAFFVNEALRVCPLCRASLSPPLQMVLPGSGRLALNGELLITRALLGDAPYISRLHARVFRLGAVFFVSSLTTTSRTCLIRGVEKMELTPGIHVPLLPNDRLRFGSGAYVETLLVAA